MENKTFLKMRKFIKKIEIIGRKIFFKILKLIIKSKKINPNDIDLRKIKTILIVRQHNELGDMLISSPMFKALKKSLPDARIILITRKVNYEVAKGIPYIDKIINYNSKEFFLKPWKFFNFIKKIRNENVDLSIVPSTVSFSLTSALISFFSKAKIKLGGEVEGVVYPDAEVFFNIYIKVNTKDKHQVDVNLEFLKPLGIDNVKDRELCLKISDEDERWADNWFKENSIGKEENLIGVHPGAGKIENRWDVDKLAEVCNYILKNYKFKLLVMCGPKEIDLKNKLIKNLNNKNFIEVPLLPLIKLAGIIKRCKLFICNDTGILHVAAGVGATTFAIFGKSNPKFWNPPGENHYSIWDLTGDIHRISSEDVIKKIRDILSKESIG
jgi:heptosyltransferase-2